MNNPRIFGSTEHAPAIPILAMAGREEIILTHSVEIQINFEILFKKQNKIDTVPTVNWCKRRKCEAQRRQKPL